MRYVTRRTLALLAALALAVAPSSAVRIALAAPPPDAVDDTYSADEDTPKTVVAPGVLSNDSLGGDGQLCVGSVDQSNLHGSLEWSADGSYTYTPSSNYHGAGSGNSFTYTMHEVTAGDPCDSNQPSTATVEITVNAVNDAPSATADSFLALRNTTLNIGAPGVLSNDSDIDGDSLTAQKVNDPAHGIVVLAANGSFSYTPAANYTGPDTFSYKAFDGTATSSTRVVTITVSGVPPIATPTPIPTPTPVPTAPPTLTPLVTQPVVDATLEPGASPTAFVPPTAQVPGGVTPSAGVGTGGPSFAPGQTPQPEDSSGSGLGSPLTILLGITLLALIVGVAAAMYGPRWLEARRNREH